MNSPVYFYSVYTRNVDDVLRILLLKAQLSKAEVGKGLRMVIGDGLATEAMTVFTG
jgi:hypothetical protein